MSQKPPPTLTHEQAEKLLTSLRNREGTIQQQQRGRRDYLMGLLMLDAGLRVGELCKLLITDLMYLNEPVRAVELDSMITKYKVSRIVPLTERIQKAIEAMQVRWWSVDESGAAFYAFYSSGPEFPLSTRQAQRIIKRAGFQAFGRDIHPHILRHTFATRLMRKVPTRVLQELLGHKQLTSTQIYTHPNAEDLKNAIDTLNGEAVK